MGAALRRCSRWVSPEVTGQEIGRTPDLGSGGRSALSDCFADGGHDFVCPEVQCRVAEAVARTEQVDESGGAVFKHGESQFLYPLGHSASDPAALVVAGLW